MSARATTTTTPEEAPLAVGAQLWRNDGDEMVSAVVEVERTDSDEVKIEANGIDAGPSYTIYLSRRAARMVAQVLGEQADRKWS